MDLVHPQAFRPEDHAVFRDDKMAKGTLFQSDRLLVGTNCFLPGQEHALHAHRGMDKVYHVVKGRGTFLLEGREEEMEQGSMLIAPDGVPHGIRNDSDAELVIVVILAPAPAP